MELAPIVLFVYNRPWHTEQTLNTLSQNDLAGASMLYIIADGPRDDATDETLSSIAQTRLMIKSKQWCKEVIIAEKEKNMGLANSIISGVTAIVNKHGKIIVMEDDLITSKRFLNYMNDGLDMFQGQQDIGSICAYWDSAIRHNHIPDYFILNGGDCWGWATWKDRWSKYIHDPVLIKNELLRTNRLSLFDYGGMASLLDQQIEGRIDSWHIRWQGSLILNNLLSIFPKISFVTNIGLDGSGTHKDVIASDYANPCINLNDYKTDLREYSIDTLKKDHPRNEKIIRKLFFHSFTGRDSNLQRIKRKIMGLKKLFFK